MTHSRSSEHAVRGPGPEYLLELWHRRKWVGVLVFAAVLAGAVTVTLSLPDLYRASATVFVQKQQVSEAFLDVLGDGRARDANRSDPSASDEPRTVDRFDLPAESVSGPQSPRGPPTRWSNGCGARSGWSSPGSIRRSGGAPRLPSPELQRAESSDRRGSGQYPGGRLRGRERQEPHATGDAHVGSPANATRRREAGTGRARAAGERVQVAPHRRAARTARREPCGVGQARHAAPPQRRVSASGHRASGTARASAGRGEPPPLRRRRRPAFAPRTRS